MDIDSQNLPTSFIWRGIKLERVIYRERVGGYTFGSTGGEIAERPSNPAIFSGTVGNWRYQLKHQADDSWLGTIYLGATCNEIVTTSKNPLEALSAAAEWWASIVKAIPVESAE
jgi:hypothetical protein